MFLLKRQLGPGYIAPLQSLSPNLNGFKLVYTVPGNNATAAALSQDLLERALSSVNKQDANIVQVQTNAALERACPTNFNGRSECFAGILFTGIDPNNQALVSRTSI
jgi:ATP-binding cassette subfamily A (ABC1) protein 3